MKSFFVTTPIYYVNGEPHLGHYYANSIADVLARYHRQYSAGEAFFLTGTDEHGQKVANQAQSLAISPQLFVDNMSQIWQTTWQSLDLSYDFFIRTTHPTHIKLTQAVIQKFLETGDVYLQEYEALYCVGAEAFVSKSELREGGLCPDHDEQPQIIQEKNYFFRLTKYKPIIQELILTDKIRIIPESRKNESLELLQNPDLGDLSVTRQQVSWGIPVPFDSSQTLYVWIDALFNYMSGILAARNIEISNMSFEQILSSIQEVWPPDLQIIGKDILKFHTIFWPAFLLALGVPEEKLPKTILVTGMFVSEGRKMSKSLGNIIDPKEVISYFNSYTTNLGNDILRYVVLREMKIGNDGDLSLDKIKHIYQVELVNKFGNTFSRVLAMAKKYGVTFNPSSKLAASPEYHQAMQAYDIYTALSLILEDCNLMAQQIQELKPWELYRAGEDNWQLAVALSGWIARLYRIQAELAPILPQVSKRMQQVLQQEEVGHIFPQLG